MTNPSWVRITTREQAVKAMAFLLTKIKDGKSFYAPSFVISQFSLAFAAPDQLEGSLTPAEVKQYRQLVEAILPRQLDLFEDNS